MGRMSMFTAQATAPFAPRQVDTSPRPHHIQCIGPGGQLVLVVDGTSITCPAPQPGAYVRAVVSGPRGTKAWVQPWRRPQLDLDGTAARK
jgi:hypothetical protein